MTNRGVLALNKELELTLTEQFDLNPKEVAEKYLKLEAGESFPELNILLKKLASAVSSIQCIDSHLTDLVASQTTIPVSRLTDMILSKQIREQIPEKLIEAGLIESQKAFFEHLREVGVALARVKLRRAGEERDRLVIQAVHAIDELQGFENGTACTSLKQTG